MWRIIILISFLFLTCSSDNKEQSHDRERLILLKKLIETQQKLDSIKTDNADLLERQKRASANNMAMIQQTLNYNAALLDAKYLSMKNDDILKEKDEIVRQDIELKKRNEQLIKENEGYKYKLNSEIENHSATKKQKAALEKDVDYASEMTLSSVKAIGVGYTLAIFGKPKAIQTNEVRKVKAIGVFFTLPANRLAKKEAKNIVITMYSADSMEDVKKDTVINYVGIECNVALYLKPKKEFKSGKHLINITVNGKLQSEKEFNIVN